MPAIHFPRQALCEAFGKYFLQFPPQPGRGDGLVYFLEMKKLRFQVKHTHVQGPNIVTGTKWNPLNARWPLWQASSHRQCTLGWWMLISLMKHAERGPAPSPRPHLILCVGQTLICVHQVLSAWLGHCVASSSSLNSTPPWNSEFLQGSKGSPRAGGGARPAVLKVISRPSLLNI